MTDRIFLLVPSPHPTGPIKGTFALANALVREHRVTIVFVKDGPGVNAWLDPQVDMLHLSGGGTADLVHEYARLLEASGGRSKVASLSMCFSADRINARCRPFARTCTSVRGNLFINYRLDYGLAGLGLALRHLWMLRGMDHIVAMTESMRSSVRRVIRRDVAVIGNFVDEHSLNAYRSHNRGEGPIRFVFVGGLNRRKKPDLLVREFGRIASSLEVTLDIIGSGPLKHELTASSNIDGSNILIHGHLDDPLPLVADADVFVLPSLSEGVSRAALEALCLGVPCILRRVDGNEELIDDVQRGVLFERDEDLHVAMQHMAERVRLNDCNERSNLLPCRFRQDDCAQAYATLLSKETG